MKGIINYIKDDDFKMNIIKNEIDIVNYIDLLSMSEERVSLTTKIGRIVIKGKELAVKKLLNKEILIKGSITNIEMGDNDV